MAQDAYLDQLVARGVVSPRAAERMLAQRRPSGAQQWQSAIQDQRQRQQWDALKPSAGEKIGQGIKQYIQGGLPEVLRGSFGIESPDWVNSANAVLHNPDVNAAIGMALPLKGAGIAQEAASAAKPSITAYHGSPHDFDRFDISRIGTGEGAQAYGHGLYFAENEGVAKSYRNIGKDVRNLSEDQFLANSALRQAGGNRDKALASLEANARRSAGDSMEPLYNKAADLVRSGWDRGKLYQVSIKADPENFLDWDKPWSEQSEQVKKAVAGSEFFGFGGAKDPLEAAGRKAEVKKVYGNWTVVDNAKMGGYIRMQNKEAAEKLAQELDDKARNEEFQNLLKHPETAARLQKAGIPGIKYLDQGSRTAGEGSRNYVVFDDKLIDILRKYGIAGIGALPAMGAYHFQDSDLKGR